MRRSRDSAALARLDRARLLGAVAIGVLGQFTVDFPGGYFGASDDITPFGAAFSWVLVSLALAATLLRGRWPGPAMALTSVTYSLNIGAFVAPLSTDPILASGVILWHVVLLGQSVFRSAPYSPRAAEPGSVTAWIFRNGPAARHLLTASLLSTTIAVGFRLGDRIPAQIVCLSVGAAAFAWTARLIVRMARERHPALLLVGGAALGAIVVARHPDVALGLLAVAQATLLVVIVMRQPAIHDLVQHFYRYPAALLLGTFVALIAVGALLLSFPASSATGAPIAAVDAVFTATSASCVTGLIVLDTPHDFSRFGQAVILGLIQVGGWNIMVLSAFAALSVGRGFGLRGRRAVREMLDVEPRRSGLPLVRFIILATLVIEGVGAVILGVDRWLHGLPAAEAAWQGLFHSVSAFCNAGFALNSDSLVGFQQSPTVLVTVTVLITLGGLGFGVLAAVWYALWRRERGDMGTHVHLVLLVSTLLTFGAAAWYAGVEWNHSLAGLGAGDKLVNALFQSATLRTAGFNSVDLGVLAPGTTLVMMTMMLIGASPGGTGGGIKTTTAAVLLGAIPALATGKPRVTLLGRAVPLETIFRSAVIAVLTVVLVFLGTLGLLVTQDLDLVPALFEAVSAIATVGLSLGATAGLDEIGKAILVVLMLLGRIGPLSAALLLARRHGRFLRPEARLMVG